MPPTLARRYLFKLLANMASVPVYLAMEAILPRALGPHMYGNYSFSTSLFLQFSGFLDMGSSTCFYNSLSRRPSETALFSFYLRIVLAVCALLLLTGIITLWQPLGRLILPDMPLWLAPMAACWAALTWLGRVLRSINDALGATIPSEIWRAAFSLLGVSLLIILFFTGFLNLHTLFLQQYLLLGATALAFWHVSRSHWNRAGLRPCWGQTKDCGRQYAKEFIDYSHPLLIQALLSFFMLSAERWLLQWFDGSAQQGFYALSQKVGMACFLFVSAMTPLLMRELSVAWGKNDRESMGRLITRFAPGLYCVAAYFSCFTLAEGAVMVRIFGGAEFAQAVLPVQIMALYPLHQAYGQMATSVFHASGKTSILRNLTALECVYGLVITWLMLAPANLGGLNLGATGLALKTVGVQFFTVNLCLWLASKLAPFSFWRNFAHQLWCAALFFLLAFACRELSSQAAALAGHPLTRFFISGIAYSILAAIAVMIAPGLMGLTRKDIREIATRAVGALKKKK